MTSVCIIDTSVFLNLLNVPGKNQDIDTVRQSYGEYVELGVTFMLPMATVIETGNHIAQSGDGETRRDTARRFCETVRGSFEGVAPYRPCEFPNSIEILDWIERFPDCAGRNKSMKKRGEGTSFGDLSIIEEFEKCIRRFSMSEVYIWSLDDDLKNYHRKP